MTSETAARRVLIVEDEGMVAMLLEDMLAELGHHVVATTGKIERAIQLVSENAIDFAVLDVNVNGEPSYSLASVLEKRGIPFAFATGYGSSGLEPQWRTTPALQKPFQMRDLERIIGIAMAGR